MAEVKINKKGVALFLALAVVLVVCILADIIMTIMASQNKLTGHQVNRIRAYYAAQAFLNYTIEKIKDGTYVPNSTGGANKYVCMNDCIDETATYSIYTEANISNKVQVTIFPWEGSGGAFGSTVKLDAKVEYSHDTL